MGPLSQVVTWRAEPRSRRRKPSEAVVRCGDKQASPAVRPSGFRSETGLDASDLGWSERRRGGSCHRTVPDVLARHAHLTGHVLRCVRKAVRRHPPPRPAIGHNGGALSPVVTWRAEPRSRRRKPSEAVVRCGDKQASPAVRPSGFRSETGLDASDLGWSERRRGGSCHRTVPDVLARHAHLSGHVLRCVRKAVRRHPPHPIGHNVGPLSHVVT